MSQFSDTTQISAKTLQAEKSPIQEDVVNLLKAQKDDVPIGKMNQAIIPMQSHSKKQMEIQKQKLNRFKIWNSKSNEDMNRINEIYKLYRRKFGRNAQHIEEFYTLISRTNQDLELVLQLIQFEDKFLQKYIQMRCTEQKQD